MEVFLFPKSQPWKLSYMCYVNGTNLIYPNPLSWPYRDQNIHIFFALGMHLSHDKYMVEEYNKSVGNFKREGFVCWAIDFFLFLISLSFFLSRFLFVLPFKYTSLIPFTRDSFEVVRGV